MRIDDEDFGRIITATPLVSIDLIVRNPGGQVLLGFRRNRPASGCWFVPGGRIRKNEPLRDALARIALAELGTEVRGGRLLGAFDHLYEDNALGLPGIGTHYVALGYECMLDEEARPRPDQQHAELRWWDLAALLTSAEVHVNTKLYFQGSATGGLRCSGS